ncbi:MAG: hypothetical protein R3281_18570, partial [Balneolaceae bacterium]|nr:hypothetical protein [Balneolaceae bacterium]
MLVFIGSLAGCTLTENGQKDNQPLFERVSPGHSNITFENNLAPTEELNTYTYRNFYNGGGVAIGDINNDSLPDIFLTGNQVD